MKISIQNFRTISNLELTFDERTLVWAANGAGKSNIVSAFQWVFTGRCYVSEGAQENLSQLIQKGSETCRVVYEDEHILIDRTGGKKALRVLIDGIELKGNNTEVEEQLQKHLGVAGWRESEIGMEWLRSVALSPDSPTIFDMKRTDLGQFLSSLFHLEVFTRLKQSFQEDFSKVDSELRTLEKYPVEKAEIINVSQLTEEQARLTVALVNVPNAQMLVQLGFALTNKLTQARHLELEQGVLDKAVKQLAALAAPQGLVEAKQKLDEIDRQLFGKKKLTVQMDGEFRRLKQQLGYLETESMLLSDDEVKEPEIPLPSIEHDFKLNRALAQEAESSIQMLEASLNGKHCPACGAELLVTMTKLELLDKPKVESLLNLERTKLRVWQRNIAVAEADKERWNVYHQSLVSKEKLKSLRQQRQSLQAQIIKLEAEIEEAKVLEPLFQNRSVLALKVSELERAEREFAQKERKLLNQKAELEAKVAQLPILKKEIDALEAKIASGENHAEDFQRLEMIKVKIAQAEMQNKLAEQFHNYENRLAALKQQKEFYAFCLSEATFLLSHQIETCKGELEAETNKALIETELENQVKIDLAETKDGEIKGVEIKVWSCGEWRNFATGINSANKTVLRTIAGIVQRNLFESRLKAPFLLIDDPGYGCQNEVLENLFAGLKKLAKGKAIVFTAFKGAEALLEPERTIKLEMLNNETRLA